MSKLHFEFVTEDVGLQVVLLQEGHIAIAFTARISNQTPASSE